MELNVRINGKEHRISGGTVLLDCLLQAGYHPERIAVEKNGEIVPKSEYRNTMLAEGDTLEVVQFVGGG